MITAIAAGSCLLAVLPAMLFLRNLALYRPAPAATGGAVGCSVLIPARNEEANITRALRAILADPNAGLEVIVLDDGSTDRTAAIVREVAATDSRLRLEAAPPLPPGWCGKQHACHRLSQLAQQPLLLFVDADVRLRPGAIDRLAAFMDASGAALVSGIPREETGTLSEQLLIPLIHFVMLGFLPLDRMRTTRDPGCSAGCGQLFMARRETYLECGGHRAIAGSLLDGGKLPRAFRAAGFATDLVDATDLATCRMYSNAGDTWRGLGRFAHEGLGSPALIGPATIILFGGQILPPFLLFIFAVQPGAPPLALLFAAIGTVAVFLPRLLAVRRFRQSLLGAILHPIGIAGLLGIQWFAFLRSLFRRPAVWKGRSYPSGEAAI